MYKLRNKLTGQFSSGGAYPRWVKRGRLWHARHHVDAHLKGKIGRQYSIYEHMENVELVEYRTEVVSETVCEL